MRKPKVRKHRSKLYARARRSKKRGFWITKDILEKILKTGDSFAISKFEGFPVVQDLGGFFEL